MLREKHWYCWPLLSSILTWRKVYSTFRTASLCAGGWGANGETNFHHQKKITFHHLSEKNTCVRTLAGVSYLASLTYVYICAHSGRHLRDPEQIETSPCQSGKLKRRDVATSRCDSGPIWAVQMYIKTTAAIPCTPHSASFLSTQLLQKKTSLQFFVQLCVAAFEEKHSDSCIHNNRIIITTSSPSLVWANHKTSLSLSFHLSRFYLFPCVHFFKLFYLFLNKSSVNMWAYQPTYFLKVKSSAHSLKHTCRYLPT
jgi:hypothetical protein